MPHAEPVVSRLAIVGIGLIGSSIARAAREYGVAREIVLADANADVVARARALDLGDLVFTSARDAVEGADLVIVCVPVGACGRVAEMIGTNLKPGAIVTDVGSVKETVIADMAPHVPAHAHLIPGHPVAGTENSGPDAGYAELFINRWCILTPPAGADPAAVETVSAFWRAMGAHVETMTPAHHDKVLAITSHVPHLIAYAIVGTADDLQAVTRSEVIKFSAGGFRDFTRIAASDPTMWRDVFLNNREAVLEMLGRLQEDIAYLARAIRWGEGDKLHDLFTRTRAIRRSIITIGQDSADPDFGRRRPPPPAVSVPRPYGGDDEDMA
jgi:cyclohexadieny/prephenate dehydrogenase